jgi:hypothetical protein
VNSVKTTEYKVTSYENSDFTRNILTVHGIIKIFHQFSSVAKESLKLIYYYSFWKRLKKSFFQLNLQSSFILHKLHSNQTPNYESTISNINDFSDLIARGH